MSGSLSKFNYSLPCSMILENLLKSDRMFVNRKLTANSVRRLCANDLMIQANNILLIIFAGFSHKHYKIK